MKICLILLVAVMSVAPFGCSGALDTACAKALPTITSAQALVADAQTARDQAEQIVLAIPDQAVRDKALIALGAVDSGLRAAESALHAAATACTAPDVGTIFADFIKAWQALAPFIALLGGEGGSRVPTPLVMMHGGGGL